MSIYTTYQTVHKVKLYKMPNSTTHPTVQHTIYKIYQTLQDAKLTTDQIVLQAKQHNMSHNTICHTQYNMLNNKTC